MPAYQSVGQAHVVEPSEKGITHRHRRYHNTVEVAAADVAKTLWRVRDHRRENETIPTPLTGLGDALDEEGEIGMAEQLGHGRVRSQPDGLRAPTGKGPRSGVGGVSVLSDDALYPLTGCRADARVPIHHARDRGAGNARLAGDLLDGQVTAHAGLLSYGFGQSPTRSRPLAHCESAPMENSTSATGSQTVRGGAQTLSERPCRPRHRREGDGERSAESPARGT